MIVFLGLWLTTKKQLLDASCAPCASCNANSTPCPPCPVVQCEKCPACPTIQYVENASGEEIVEVDSQLAFGGEYFLRNDAGSVGVASAQSNLSIAATPAQKFQIRAADGSTSRNGDKLSLDESFTLYVVDAQKWIMLYGTAFVAQASTGSAAQAFKLRKPDGSDDGEAMLDTEYLLRDHASSTAVGFNTSGNLLWSATSPQNWRFTSS